LTVVVGRGKLGGVSFAGGVGGVDSIDEGCLRGGVFSFSGVLHSDLRLPRVVSLRLLFDSLLPCTLTASGFPVSDLDVFDGVPET
jgi:hypothetical protein